MACGLCVAGISHLTSRPYLSILQERGRRRSAIAACRLEGPGCNLDLPFEGPCQIPSSCIRMKSVHIEDTVEAEARQNLNFVQVLHSGVPAFSDSRSTLMRGVVLASTHGCMSRTARSTHHDSDLFQKSRTQLCCLC